MGLRAVCAPSAASNVRRTTRQQSRPSRVAVSAAGPKAGVNEWVYAAKQKLSAPRLVGWSALANVVAAKPAAAQGMFDFDLTLVAEASQVIILMIILDKIVFTPVGETIDKRDEEIKSKLANVKDNSKEVEEIYERARKTVAEARQEVNEKIAEAKKSTQDANQQKLNEVKSKLDSELEQSLASLRQQQEDSLNKLEPQAEQLADTIVAKCLPVQSK